MLSQNGTADPRYISYPGCIDCGPTFHLETDTATTRNGTSSFGDRIRSFCERARSLISNFVTWRSRNESCEVLAEIPQEKEVESTL
ncbi:14 kDa lytic protein splice variant A [Gallid alphaherpesvirus 2]|uniref:Uncharacterized gene 6a protein n=4 Tax=Alphaherpesvirinae TaxID=10293 RepID=VG06A_GAHVM|nr:RecName: Full=Uncharacterized gene 6a protein [Marek's disease herpesvirus type 1 strain MD5]AAG14287.1 14kD lytic phase protein [Gallid alphaherpesvirus 2]ACF49512.1 14kD-A [synthetic construct]AEV55075.1 14 kDa A protein [Gallid herpesvirus 2 strain 814]AAG14288.1 14kD lytic phase protein [Gallid alphaherpesvirus 2]AAS01706.1 14 kDa lytic phase protein alternate a [Gallid alphaherpesvirus 2]